MAWVVGMKQKTKTALDRWLTPLQGSCQVVPFPISLFICPPTKGGGGGGGGGWWGVVGGSLLLAPA